MSLAGGTVTSFALLLHELATNAAKYGALSVDDGGVDISCTEDEDYFALTWSERGGPIVSGPNQTEGFGTLLAKGTVEGQLGERFRATGCPKA